MLKVNVNNKFPFEFEGKTDENEWDIAQIGENQYHIIRNNQSYNIFILQNNPAEKSMKIRVNGNDYDLVIQDKYDLLLKKLGMNNMLSVKINQIKAPMPGLVLDLMVNKGDTLQIGTPVLILEAMKMENIIKSPGDGVVKKILIRKGDPVEKNAILIELE